MSALIVVKRGMRIVFKPEWRDKGDDTYTFVAVEDAHPIDGSFYFSAIENTMWIRPQSPARAHMVEVAKPYLPVITLTFLGLDKKGARVQMRRTIGDHELSVTIEMIARSTFRALFRRGAADCKAGLVLCSSVEFPDNPAKGVSLLIERLGLR